MMRANMSWIIRAMLVASIAMWSAGSQVSKGQEFILNGDFQQDLDLWVVWPGYVNGADDNGINPPEISEWFNSGGVGINPVQPGCR